MKKTKQYVFLCLLSVIRIFFIQIKEKHMDLSFYFIYVAVDTKLKFKVNIWIEKEG